MKPVKILWHKLTPNATIPTTIKIGNAIYINPPTTRPINIKGSNTTVSKNFESPQAALIFNYNVNS